MPSCFLSNFTISTAHGGGTTVAKILGNECAQFNWCFSYGGWGRYGTPIQAVLDKTLQIDFPLDYLPRRTPVRQFRVWLRSFPAIRDWEERTVVQRFLKEIGAKSMRMLVCPQDQLTVRLVASAAQVDYITWVMDDHELTESSGVLGYEKCFESLWQRHLQSARRVFVISDAMKSFYADRFGVESVVLHGAVPKSTGPASNIHGGSGPLRVGYAGSVFGWQEDALNLLAEAMDGFRAELHYAGSGKPVWLQNENVRYHGRLTSDETLNMLRSCDATLLPMSFLPKFTALSRLNIATKLSELCAIGVPILAIGPADAAMIRQLSSRKAAICVISPTHEAIIEGLARAADSAYASECAANARAWFEQEINLEEMQARWQPWGEWLFEPQPN